MVLENLNTSMQKTATATDHMLHHNTKINSKLVIDLNVKSKRLKLKTYIKVKTALPTFKIKIFFCQ